MGPKWVKRSHQVSSYPKSDTKATKPEDLEGACYDADAHVNNEQNQQMTRGLHLLNSLSIRNFTQAQYLCTTPGRESYPL